MKVPAAARSLLFVPGDRGRFFDKLPGLACDAVIIDLEDAVVPEARVAARALTVARLPGMSRPGWVRVNAIASGEMTADLAAVVGVPGLAGVVAPKVGDAADVRALDAALAAAERDRGLRIGATPVIAMIESARGVVFAHDIAIASPRIASLCFGGARDGDLQTDLGAEWSIEGPEMLHARQQVLLAARAAGLAWPLDGVFADVTDSAGFERDTFLSRRLGYRGRTVIHPSQIEPVNRLYAPSEAEVAFARRVLEAAAAARAEGHGATLVDGRLIDRAMVRHAEATLELQARQ